MDLNDLFCRQQIARSLADTASSEAIRNVYVELIREYKTQIALATAGSMSDGEAHPLFDWHLPKANVVKAPKANQTLAVAMTAREFDMSRRKA
jgi:hypothetical protein